MSRKHGTALTLDRPQERLTAKPHEIMSRAPLRAAYEQMRIGFDSCSEAKLARWRWDACPDIRPLNPSIEDIRGLRSGRLVCVGLAPEKKGNNRAAWIVRCDCGWYECRSAKAMKNTFKPWHACTECEHRISLWRRSFRTAKGRYPTDAEVMRLCA